MPSAITAPAQLVLEQNPLIVGSSVPHPEFCETIAEPQINIVDVPWDIKSIMSKPIFVQTATWTVAQGTDFVFDFVDILSILNSSNSRAATTLRRFRYFRGNFTVRLQLTSTNFHLGKIKVYATSPVYPGESANNSASVRSSASVELDASHPGTSMLRIPFSQPRHYYEFQGNTQGNLGVVRGYVMQGLQVPEGVATGVTISCWLSIDDCQVAVPISDITTPYVPTPYELMFPNSNHIPRDFGNFEAEVQSLQTPKANVVSDRLGIQSYNPLFLDCTALAPMILGTNPNINSPATQITGSTDVGSLDDFRRLEGQINRFTWTSANTPGTQLISFDNSPFPEVLYQGGQNYGNAPLSWASTCFEYWRGGITYTIRFAKPRFAQGKLQIQFYPRGHIGSTPAELDECYSMVIDISETTEFTFTVPYMDSVEWKSCGSVKTSSNDERTGQVFVTVLTNLILPESAVSSIEGTLWIKAASDFQWASPVEPDYSKLVFDAMNYAPTNTATTLLADMVATKDGDFSKFYRPFIDFISNGIYVSPLRGREAEIQSALTETTQINNAEEDDVHGFVLGPKEFSKIKVTTARHDVIDGLEDLLKRPRIVVRYQGGTFHLSMNCYKPLPNYLTHFSKCYRYFSGDLTVIVIPPARNEIFTQVPSQLFATYFPNEFGPDYSSGASQLFLNTTRASAFCTFPQSSTFAFTVPLSSRNPMLVTTRTAPSDSKTRDGTYTGGAVQLTGPREDWLYNIYLAGGPNLKFRRWLGPPGDLANVRHVFLDIASRLLASGGDWTPVLQNLVGLRRSPEFYGPQWTPTTPNNIFTLAVTQQPTIDTDTIGLSSYMATYYNVTLLPVDLRRLQVTCE